MPTRFYAKDHNKRINLAMITATIAHWSQARKGDHSPYIFHPIAVLELVKKHSDLQPEERKKADIAALLHDVLEDTWLPAFIIRIVFGKETLADIYFLSKDKQLSGDKQFTEHLGRLLAAPKHVRCVKLADVLNNLDNLPEEWFMNGNIDVRMQKAEKISANLNEASSQLANLITEKVVVIKLEMAKCSI